MATLASPMRFSGKPVPAADGGLYKVLRLPQDVSDALSSRGLVAVSVVLEGHSFLAVAWPDGRGGHWIKVAPDLEGEVTVEVAQSKDWPEPEVPVEVTEALEAWPQAHELWSKISAATRTDWLYWLDSAKKAETRVKRIASMCDMLAKGKKKVCCFDRSGIYSKTVSCSVADGE